MSHDQNFKNLILDYPREALAFFAPSEVADLLGEVRITPLRQGQLQERLGERFRELDIPLLVEWPDGRRAAVLFVIEQESEARRFSIHRLIHYCTDLSELCQTERVVPVVVFLHGAPRYRALRLGSDRATYLDFTYIACELAAVHYRRYHDSPNIVARLNLPNMRHERSERLAVYAAAVRGLTSLETDPERQLKHLDFIDIYAALDDDERQRYSQEYPEEAKAMTSFAERFREQGMQKGEAAVVVRLLQSKFGDLPETARERIEAADPETLLVWSERILTASSLDEVLH